MELGNALFVEEEIMMDAHGVPCAPVRRVAAMAVLRNALAGRHVEDLTELFEIGADLGEQLAPLALPRLACVPVSYGKDAIVGLNGDMEQGSAVIHPRLGKPMRAAAAGGEAVIPSNVKLGGPGVQIDLPLGHKDNPWSFYHFDTMPLRVGDAPLPDEIVMILAYADGGRPIPRCGKGLAG